MDLKKEEFSFKEEVTILCLMVVGTIQQEAGESKKGRFARATSLNMGKEWSQPTRQGDSGSCNSKDSVEVRPGRGRRGRRAQRQAGSW